MMKRAFTLLELMVATMLLAMLVTILTMIFNQSSIAWTIGMASVAGLSDTREEMAMLSNEAENLIMPDKSGSTPLKIVSVFDPSGSGLYKKDGRTLTTTFEKLNNVSEQDVADPMRDRTHSVNGAATAGRNSFLVGVTSYGPDGEADTWDDITTMPEEVVK